ncbi:MAG: hypothetical protein VKJ06_08160 [Vampirovibrionales bacterium]|nr:hypothetical protein [Vampirovibrionales bacterium]
MQAIQTPLMIPPLSIQPMAQALEKGMPQFSAPVVQQAYTQLPTLSRQTVDGILPKLSANTLADDGQSGRLDLIEEIADVAFETERYLAAKKQLIPHMGAAFWLKVHQQTQGPNPISFRQLLSEVSDKMPDASVQKFEHLTQLPQAEARQFLALLTLRMGYEGGNVVSPKAELKKYGASAREEITELLEQFPQPKGMQRVYTGALKLQAHLMKHAGVASNRLTAWAVNGLMRSAMGQAYQPVAEKSLMQLAEFKRTLRSELNYPKMHNVSFDDFESHADRRAFNMQTKRIAKPFEAISVAAVLQGIEPAFKLANAQA